MSEVFGEERKTSTPLVIKNRGCFIVAVRSSGVYDNGSVCLMISNKFPNSVTIPRVDIPYYATGILKSMEEELIDVISEEGVLSSKDFEVLLKLCSECGMKTTVSCPKCLESLVYYKPSIDRDEAIWFCYNCMAAVNARDITRIRTKPGGRTQIMQ